MDAIAENDRLIPELREPRPYRGMGYATEAVGALARVAFGPLGLHRLEAHVFAGNRRSEGVLRRPVSAGRDAFANGLGRTAGGSMRSFTPDCVRTMRPPLEGHRRPAKVARYHAPGRRPDGPVALSSAPSDRGPRTRPRRRRRPTGTQSVVPGSPPPSGASRSRRRRSAAARTGGAGRCVRHSAASPPGSRTARHDPPPAASRNGPWGSPPGSIDARIQRSMVDFHGAAT